MPRAVPEPSAPPVLPLTVPLLVPPLPLADWPRSETVTPPPLRSLIAGLQPGKASQPILTPDGVIVMMVCSREQRNLAELTPEQARQQILRDRVENLSRQLQRDLRRRANIETRS